MKIVIWWGEMNLCWKGGFLGEKSSYARPNLHIKVNSAPLVAFSTKARLRDGHHAKPEFSAFK